MNLEVQVEMNKSDTTKKNKTDRCDSVLQL